MNGTTEPGKKSTALLILLFAFLGLSLILVNHIENRLLSSSRAFVTGQVYWVKAQKEASLSLVRYIITLDESDYSDFIAYLDVIDGDRIARDEIFKEDTDYSIVEDGFIRGNNPPENVRHLTWLLEKFASFGPISQAIVYWIEGEEIIDSMKELAEEYREKIKSGEIDNEEKEEIIHQIFEKDKKLSELESLFEASVNQGSNRLSNLSYRVNMVVIIVLTFGIGLIVFMRIREMRSWHEKTRLSENRFREVLSNSRDIIYQLDIETGKYIYISPSVKTITGYDEEEFLNGGVEFVLSITHPEDRERMESEVIDYGDAEADARLKNDSQFRIKRKDGEYIWINNRRSLMRDENGLPISIIGNVRDISERKKYMDALDNSLQEKEMLLSEVHHRVKNNLSIVSSLVELQKSKPGAASEEDFKEIQSRIKSIALVHEKLYENKTFADVDLARYLGDLVDMIHDTFDSRRKKIVIHKKLSSVTVNIKIAVPLGLICNELINNCYKYAFEGQDEGEIVIELNVDGNEVLFKVSDNGTGLPKSFDELKKESLGMTLIRVFVKQIQGELEYSTNNGAHFSVKFETDNNG